MKTPPELTLLTLSRKLDALAADVRAIRKALSSAPPDDGQKNKLDARPPRRIIDHIWRGP